MSSVANGREFVQRVYTDVSEKNIPFMAAGLAYSAFVSLAPLLILLFLVLTLVGGGLEARIIEFANQWLPGPIADVVQQTFIERSDLGSASVVGLIVLIWGALKIFRGLDTAFSEIYGTVGRNSFVNKLKDGVVVLFALGVAVVATVGTSAAFTVFADTIPFSGYAMPLVLLVGLVVAFLPMYYVFPDRELSVRDVLPGAIVAAVGWAAFQSLFQVYLTFSDPGAGSFAGSVIIVITYLYFSALVLLLGAVINAVTGGYSSGHAGGVSDRASLSQPRREASLNRDEVDAYLRGLNRRLTTTHVVSGAGEKEMLPQAEGDVHLVEYATNGEEGNRWTVQLSWTPVADSPPDDSEDAVTSVADN